MDVSSEPEVTVVTATYNSRDTLQYTVRSVLNQSFINFEYWIIGDYCTDGTEEMVQATKDPRVNWFNRSENSGSQPAPNNEGIRRARGKYIAYIGHDDLWLPWHLEDLLNYLKKNDLDYGYSLTVDITSSGVRQVRGNEIIGNFPHQFFAPTSSCIHKKNIVKHVGYWEEDHWSLAQNPDQFYQQKILNSDLKTGLYSSVSVIKFSSEFWQTYKGNKELEVTLRAYLNNILKDPESVRLDIYSQIALSFSFYNPVKMLLPAGKIYEMVKASIKHRLRSRLIKYPLFFRLYQKMFVRTKKKFNKKRGL
jgi:glycosyltransferase involved in cell wall biosynthesis